MRIPRLLFPVLVLATFALGVWGLKSLGLWKDRTRGLPPSELSRPETGPAPGGFPM